MIIERKKLIESLQLVMPGIDQKELVESMTHLHFTGKCIVTFNDAAYVSLPFPTDFQCSVHGKTLFNLLKALDSEKVKIEPVGGKLKFQSKGIAADFATGEGTEINEILQTIDKEVKGLKKIEPLPNDFHQAIELCAFSAHTKDIQGSLTNIKVKGDRVYSTDRTRFSTYLMEGSVDEFMFKAGIAADMQRYALKLYAVTKSWIHFFESKNGVIFSVRKYVGEYPDGDILGLIKGFKASAKLTLPAEVQSALQTVGIFTEGQEEKRAEISCSDGYLSISTSGVKGSINKKMKVDSTAKPFSFSINPALLNEILKRGIKTVEVGSGDVPLALFRSDKFTHCIALFGEVK
jgi:DNA polymerase III sliding clamp (beta) subunit (PCNA family)